MTSYGKEGTVNIDGTLYTYSSGAEQWWLEENAPPLKDDLIWQPPPIRLERKTDDEDD